MQFVHVSLCLTSWIANQACTVQSRAQQLCSTKPSRVAHLSSSAGVGSHQQLPDIRACCATPVPHSLIMQQATLPWRLPCEENTEWSQRHTGSTLTAVAAGHPAAAGALGGMPLQAPPAPAACMPLLFMRCAHSCFSAARAELLAGNIPLTSTLPPAHKRQEEHGRQPIVEFKGGALLSTKECNICAWLAHGTEKPSACWPFGQLTSQLSSVLKGT